MKETYTREELIQIFNSLKSKIATNPHIAPDRRVAFRHAYETVEHELGIDEAPPVRGAKIRTEKECIEKLVYWNAKQAIQNVAKDLTNQEILEVLRVGFLRSEDPNIVKTLNSVFRSQMEMKEGSIGAAFADSWNFARPSC